LRTAISGYFTFTFTLSFRNPYRQKFPPSHGPGYMYVSKVDTTAQLECGNQEQNTVDALRISKRRRGRRLPISAPAKAINDGRTDGRASSARRAAISPARAPRRANGSRRRLTIASDLRGAVRRRRGDLLTPGRPRRGGTRSQTAAMIRRSMLSRYSEMLNVGWRCPSALFHMAAPPRACRKTHDSS